MWFRCALLPLLTATLAAADQLQLSASGSHVLRPGVLQRLELRGAPAGPWSAAISITPQRRTAADSDGERGWNLAGYGPAPVVLSWEPLPVEAAGARVQVVISRPGASPLATELVCPGLESLGDRLETVLGRLSAAQAAAPATRLWVQQLAVQLAALPTAAGVALAEDRLACLEALVAGRRLPSGPERGEALSDPVDGSVQPWRLHTPAVAPRGLLLWLAGEPRPQRADQLPSLPPGVLAAAHGAGLAIAQVHVGGDPAWQGAAARRAGLVLAAARGVLGPLPSAIVAQDTAAAAALHLAARRPPGLAAVVLAEPRLVASLLPTMAPVAVQHWYRQAADPFRELAAVASLPLAGLGNFDAVAPLVQEGERLGRPAWRGAGLGDAGLWRWVAARLGETPPPVDTWRPVAPGVLAGGLVVAAPTDPARPAVLRRLGDELLVENLTQWAWPAAPAALRHDGRRLPQRLLPSALPRCDGYADAPFALIIGTGESAFASAQSRRAAERFRALYAGAALAVPPQWDDTAVTREQLAGRHLLLFGNPRSNRVLARLVDDGLDPGVVWDHRCLRLGEQEWLRSGGVGMVVARPRPDDPTRLAIILDGPATWPQVPGALPLTGLGAGLLWWSDGQLWQGLDSRWRH
jgi:hypothetical protein